MPEDEGTGKGGKKREDEPTSKSPQKPSEEAKPPEPAEASADAQPVEPAEASTDAQPVKPAAQAVSMVAAAVPAAQPKKGDPPFETVEDEMNIDDPALIAAWRRLLDYDQISSWQKGLYQRIREWVIVISLAASVLAVASTFVANWGFNTQLNRVPGEVIRVILVVLPVTGVALMNYAAQFATSTAWIEYRVSAELIRSQIYRYRTKAGEYFEKPLYERRQMLLNAIAAADGRIDDVESTSALPYIQNADKEVAQKVNAKTSWSNIDNGLGPLSVDDFIEIRVRDQLQWYINKVQNDYHNKRRDTMYSLAIAALGSVLSGIGFGLEALVAVTTAIGIALSNRSDMRMYGATYNIYHDTAAKLQRALDRWLIMPDEMRQDPQVISDYIDSIEKIFENENVAWRQQAIQMLQNSDQSIMSTVQRDTGDEKEVEAKVAQADTETDSDSDKAA